MPRKKQDPEFDHKLGAAIRRERILKNLTMRELVGAAGLDITEATMWGIESGDQRMSAFQLLRLASVLGMSVDKIFSEVTTLYSPKIEFFDQSNNKSEKF